MRIFVCLFDYLRTAQVPSDSTGGASTGRVRSTQIQRRVISALLAAAKKERIQIDSRADFEAA